jgi:hypothetical protein
LFRRVNFRNHDFKEVLLRGDLGKIGRNVVVWDGSNQRLNSAAKRLQIRFKTDLDLGGENEEVTRSPSLNCDIATLTQILWADFLMDDT